IKVSRETLILRPRVLSVGVGCNRNTPAEDILDFLKLTFKKGGLNLEAVSTFATTDVKADEDGILALGKTLDRPIKFYERDRLNSVETIENPSEMAEKYLGVKSVCEAAAILGAQRGTLIVTKQKTKDVTLAVAIPE
ncbi:MAG: cobalamin biosynthesis protein, partial [Desulfobacterales bacterium]|nr:cobalamin biosynthesis protein [Desulfobacterales bacterium]